MRRGVEEAMAERERSGLRAMELDGEKYKERAGSVSERKKLVPGKTRRAGRAHEVGTRERKGTSSKRRSVLAVDDCSCGRSWLGVDATLR